MPAPSSSTQRTPLRRVSQGSLRALARSQTAPDAPHGLAFLEPALSLLVDEAEALQVNLEGLGRLSEQLEKFNEGFASWMYVLEMNALTTDWVQVPGDVSFKMARRRAEDDARKAQETLHQAAAAERERERALQLQHQQAIDDTTEADITVASAASSKAKNANANAPPKKKAKPKLTVKERKERSLHIEKVVTCLPLEFRGSDVTLRRNIESVIETFLDNEDTGLPITHFIKPDLNQARVNKCLIALVNRKIVQKDNSSGGVLYHWAGAPQ